MKTIFTISLFIILFIPKIHAQNTFEINFGTVSDEDGRSIRQTIDGKYIVAGTTYATTTGDGDFYLAKIDTNGNVLWTKSYGGTMDESGSCVRQTKDSGFVIVGYTESYGNGLSDAYLVKTDQNGDTLWTKTYGGSGWDFGYSIQNTFDGGFIIVGQESSTDTSGIAHIYMVKTDSIGDTLWTKSYPMAAWTGATGVVQTPDSGYILVGDFENNLVSFSTYDLVWMKTNSLGNLLWTKTFEDTVANNYASAICSTSDGGFILASRAEDVLSLSYNSRLLRLDSSGDTIWTKEFNPAYNFAINDVVEASDTGIVCVGYSFDANLFANYLNLIKTDQNGDLLWRIVLDGLYTATGFGIDATSDDGLVVCGFTSDSTLMESNVYVVKTNSNGSFLSCHPIFVSQPADTLLELGENAEFVVAANSSTVAFQWQIDTSGVFVNLSDTLFFSGTHTDTLRVNGVLLSMDNFHFRCFVVDTTTCTDTSQAATLTVTNTIGIVSPVTGKNILYPNPASRHLSISGATPQSIIFFDIYGKVVASFKESRELDISFLANGVYYAKLIYKNEETVQRFVKN